jgi:hypothetical protein
VATLPAENARERNRRIGSIGSRARSSQATKATARSDPALSAATTSRLPQPAAFPRTRPHTRPNAAPVTSARPRTSRAVSGPKLSSTRASTSGISASPIGTLTQKIHAHAVPSAIAPPTSGPPSVARPVTLKKIPSADARRSGGNAALTIARASGMTSAPPAPWTARAAISQPAFGASPHAADAVTNSARPAVKTRLRPKRSPSADPVMSSTAKLRL